MSDEPIDVPAELAKAHAQFPLVLPDREIPLDMQMRTIALTIAQRHCGDTTVKEGNLYQQLKMDNKLAGPLTVDHVLHAALVFERYLWGEWSKGIAENAMKKTMTDVADAIEKEFKDGPPTRPHGGGGE